MAVPGAEEAEAETFTCTVLAEGQPLVNTGGSQTEKGLALRSHEPEALGSLTWPLSCHECSLKQGYTCSPQSLILFIL